MCLPKTKNHEEDLMVLLFCYVTCIDFCCVCLHRARKKNENLFLLFFFCGYNLFRFKFLTFHLFTILLKMCCCSLSKEFFMSHFLVFYHLILYFHFSSFDSCFAFIFSSIQKKWATTTFICCFGRAIKAKHYIIWNGSKTRFNFLSLFFSIECIRSIALFRLEYRIRT